MTTATHHWRSITFGVLEGRAENYPGSRVISRFIVALIIANGIAVILESSPSLHLGNAELFGAFEIFSVVIFTAEYIARLWAAAEHPRYRHKHAWSARLTYALRPMALVDLLAILPFYLSLLIPIDLRYLRLFRLLRLLKLSHYFDGLEVFGRVLRREAGAIAGALMIMTVITVVSACLMFTVENAAGPGNFESVAQAIWWAVVTLTTVGYGDITPVTFAGKLLGIIIMILGIGTMALPAGILAARFSQELRARHEILEIRVREALEDGILDLSERRGLLLLQEELGLSVEELERIIADQRSKANRYYFCPHCGERLSGEKP